MVRVSVVIIFLNAEAFIEGAIGSVFAQRFQDWDLLLVDDGSSDGSTGIARRFADRHPERVRYLEHQGHSNRGMSASRNLGVAEATGEYVAFLDADDIWTPAALDEQVAILDEHPDAAMVYGRLRYWFSWSDAPGDQQADFIEPLRVPENSLIQPPYLVPRFLCDRAAVPSGLLVRRTAVDRHGGFEESFRGEYEDQVFCSKICLHEPVYAASNVWYYYRQHPASNVASGHASGATTEARLTFLLWLESYLLAGHVTDRLVWLALRSEMWQFRHKRLYNCLKRTQALEHQIRNRHTIRAVSDPVRAVSK